MRKIPTLFVRDQATHRVTDQVTPGCEWVLAGDSLATRKRDGTCVMFDGRFWWARREVKPGKPEPELYRVIETDPVTGKKVGWEPAEQSSFYKFLAEAELTSSFTIGTYELCGPKINGNPEGLDEHRLFSHGEEHLLLVRHLLRDPEAFAGWLREQGMEGIVWHHLDGRRAKIKAKDFPA